MHLSREELVGRVAARQHGLITRAQAVEAGYDKAAIYRACRAGRWRIVARAVYQIVGAPWTWHTSVVRDCLANDGVASHRSCAVLLRAGPFRPGPPEITVRAGSKDHDAGPRVHEARDFDLIRSITIDGIRTTPPARLAVDLGAVVPYAQYEATIDQLVGRGDVTWAQLSQHLRSHAKRGRNGVGPFRAYLKDRIGYDVEESVLEQRILRELRTRGFPEPTTQLTVDDLDGSFLARVDLAFEPELVIIEGDSLGWHLNRRSFTKDPTVRRRLRMLGWFVVEITHDMLDHDAARTFADLRQLLSDRAPTSSSLIMPQPADEVVTTPRAGRPSLGRNTIMDDLERYFGI
jgi:hypothetical protein